jgi:hypothetical protein
LLLLPAVWVVVLELKHGLIEDDLLPICQ